MTLGTNFARYRDELRPPPPPPLPPPDPMVAVLAALAELREAIVGAVAVPTVVEVPPVDLSELVAALTSVRPTADADEIAAALAARIVQPKVSDDETAPVLKEVAQRLEELSFRLQGVGTQAYGGGSVSLARGQTVEVSNLPDVVGTFSYEAATLTTGSLTGVGRCVGIRVFAAGAAGSFDVNGGDVVTVRDGSGVDVNPQGQLVAPVVNWRSGTLDVLIAGVS